MLISSSNLNQKSFVYPKDWGQGGRGCFAGGGHDGESAFTNKIHYITIATPGNATEFGTSTTKGGCGGTSGRGRGLIIGGFTSNPDTITNDIKYVTIATLGNATDFGDLTRVTSHPACVSNGTRALVCGGESTHYGYNLELNVVYTDMTYLTIATPGNANGSFGNFDIGGRIERVGTQHYQSVGATGNGIYGMIKCVNDKYYYMSIATPGNVYLFGILSGTDNAGSSAFSNGTRAIWNAGGNQIMEYFTWSTVSTAAAFGMDSEVNGNDSTRQVGVMSNSRAVLGAGHSSSSKTHYFSMDGTPVSTLIGAVFGTLLMPYPSSRYGCASFSGD